MASIDGQRSSGTGESARSNAACSQAGTALRETSRIRRASISSCIAHSESPANGRCPCRASNSATAKAN
jgi:hypothetical protein